jgi:predicted phage tail protein
MRLIPLGLFGMVLGALVFVAGFWTTAFLPHALSWTGTIAGLVIGGAGMVLIRIGLDRKEAQ